jgi:lysophospholipase L1-like esterase
VSKRQVLAAALIAILVVTGTPPALVHPMKTSASEPSLAETRALTVAQDERGWLWAVWEVDTGTDVDLYFSHWEGQEGSVPQPIHHQPDAWDRSPSLAIAADGTPWLAWSSAARSDPGQRTLLISRWISHHWATPEMVPMGGISRPKEPTLAAAPDGTLWLAWVGFDGVDDEIYASHWDGRSWSSPQQVNADDGDPSLYDRQPRLAVGRDGQPWLVWTGHQDVIDDEIYASHWSGSGWTPEQRISQDGALPRLDVWPSLALDAKGRPWVAWQSRVTDGRNSHLRILVSRWDATGSGWTTEAVASSPLASEVDERYPALSVDGDATGGGMYLAWMARDPQGARSTLAYARWEDGRWTEPRVARADVTADAVAWATAKDSTPRLLWLEPSAAAPSPVQFAPVEETAELLSSWVERQAPLHTVEGVDPIPNRFLAFGDSITYGMYSGDPYPDQLEDKLDTRVADSEAINAGNPGEATYGGSERITGEVSDHRPRYVLIMEGTNDVTRENPPAEVYDHLRTMIDNARVTAGVDNVQVMLATLIPRLDDQNDETATMNEQAVIPAANASCVPICDQWQAFYNFGLWQSLYENDVHPNVQGLQLMANTFYDCLIAAYPDVEEETIPPTTWIASLPPSVECGQAVPVGWNGSDNLNWVVDYDVQVRVNGGEWTNWLLATQETSDLYTGKTTYGKLGFRVRGRDLVGNQSDYSSPEFTQITDSVPPYEAGVNPLPPAQTAPFTVSWWGRDACSGVVAFDVQYSVGITGTREDWLLATPDTDGSFDPPLPQYAGTYYFYVRAQDAAGRWGEWSDAIAHTVLARFSVKGHTYNVRGQPIIAVEVNLDPAPLYVEPLIGGGFLAHLSAGGDYDLSVLGSDRYGPLPAMYDLAVNDDVSGLEFLLPPRDDAVTDGGFEGGSLDTWQWGGTAVLTHTAHTGLAAVQLGSVDGDSSLSQVITPGLTLSDPTLSFLARLGEAGPPSALRVELAGAERPSTPLTDTLAVEDDRWTHVWYDLPGLVSGPLTLTFAVSRSPSILLDEISLGSSRRGQYPTYLPLVCRGLP